MIDDWHPIKLISRWTPVIILSPSDTLKWVHAEGQRTEKSPLAVIRAIGIGRAHVSP